MTSVNPLIPAVMVAAFALMAGHKNQNIPSPKKEARVQAEFTKGNIVVVRVGTGAALLAGGGTAAPCFIDEYTPAGGFVQSIPLPTAESGINKALTLGGTATSEGYITRSADGTSLALAGYNATPGTAGINNSASTLINRVVAIIKQDASINTQTSLSDAATGNNVRGAFTNGTGVWVTGGAGGLRYAPLGATSSVVVGATPANLRAVHVFGNQLYVSTNNGTAVRIGAVGAGTPITEGETIANLPGVPSNTGVPHQFFMADLSSTVDGLDVLYVADDNTTTGGILKYSLVAGSWTLTSTSGNPAELYRGITGRVSGNSVTLYAVKNGGGGGTGGGELVSLADNTGYNTAITGSPALIATAGGNQAFRGVALAPELAALPLNLLAFNSAQQGNTVAHTWRTEKETGVDHFELESSGDGEHFISLATVAAKNASVGSYQFVETTGLSATRYYRLKIIDKDGSFNFSKINRVGVELNSVLSVYPNPVQDKATIRFEKVIQKGHLTLSTIGGARVREIALSSGMQQTTINLSDLNQGIYILQSEINGIKKTTRLEKK